VKPKHLDLFSGIGGFALAAQAVGFETIGFSEIDPYASAVLKKHWPDIPNYGDVRTVPTVGCDLITGGFPCQPFSCAGKQRGSADDRFLWPAMLDVIQRCRPAWVLGENVAGIIDMELHQCCLDLASIGYDSQPFNISACAVGADHRRERIWIIANDPRLSVEKSRVALPARQISEPRNIGGGLSGSLWRFNWETYLAEMAGELYGVSNWLDRSKAIGNAIVPQVAEVILREIIKHL
jgi:DNA (cytosine-5)-methyltransferase 1